MNTVRRDGSTVVITQLPIVLLLVTALLTAPTLGVALYQLSRGIQTGNSVFALGMGVLMLWVFLEYVATRERIEIDLAGRRLVRVVSGVFRTRRQEVDLARATGLEMEITYPRVGRRTRREHLYLCAGGERHLMNSPEKVYMSQAALAKILAEVLGIPYHGVVEPARAG